MFGMLLVFLATLFGEAASTSGKKEVMAKHESIFAMGFLNFFWVAVVFFLIAIIKPGSFVFSITSLPTFGIRFLLELVQMSLVMRALVVAERSTFAFLRITTLPALLAVDLLLGYAVRPIQIVGIGVVVLVLLFMFLNHGIKKKGAGLVLFTALNAVITISLYKYNITHFNSIVAEQGLIMAGLLVYFDLLARIKKREHPLLLLKKPVFFLQSLAHGVGSLLGSFAYLFLPPSIIVAVTRSAEVLWSILFGTHFFHEQKLHVKLVGFGGLLVGLLFLAVG